MYFSPLSFHKWKEKIFTKNTVILNKIYRIGLEETVLKKMNFFPV